jgi:two-component system heavy metal sensor histidine kinase CusS
LLLDKQLEIVVHGDAEARIDHRLYHRALANLLSNSARYAFDNSTVVVDIKQDHKMVSVSVANEGGSIETEHLHQLFERFYRLDSSRSSSHIHHGLGLSIVQAVALMHQGAVFATSENGVNTFGLTMSLGLSACTSENTELERMKHLNLVNFSIS